MIQTDSFTASRKGADRMDPNRSRTSSISHLTVGPLLCGLLFASATPTCIAALGSEKGQSAGFWDDYSVIVAQVTEGFEKDGRYDVIGLRPIATLAGRFDCGATALVKSRVFVAATVSAIKELPQRGSLVLAVLVNLSAEESDRPGYHTPSDYELYMPTPYAGLCVLNGLRDHRIDDTLSATQKAHKLSDVKQPRPTRRRRTPDPAPKGFWANHALIYSQVGEPEGSDSHISAAKLKLIPKVSLAGAFDPSGVPTVVVPVDRKVAAMQPLPGNGTHALVLLTKSDGSYSISADPADFMPGEAHSPICAVWDLSDIRVSDTLKTIQLKRANDQPKEHESTKR